MIKKSITSRKTNGGFSNIFLFLYLFQSFNTFPHEYIKTNNIIAVKDIKNSMEASINKFLKNSKFIRKGKIKNTKNIVIKRVPIICFKFLEK